MSRTAELQACVRDLNRLYRENRQLHAVDFHYSGFEWIDFADSDNSIVSFLRKSRDSEDPVDRRGQFHPGSAHGLSHRGASGGRYRVIFNSDSEAYGGSNMGNGHEVTADPIEKHGRPFSLNLACLRWP